MRPFLMSTAALVFLTVPALAQPGNDRGDRSHDSSQSQDRGQAGPSHQNQAAPQSPAAPQQPHGPTNRGHDNAAPVIQPQAAAPNRGDRGRTETRGGDQGRNRGTVQAPAPVAQPQATFQNRGDRGQQGRAGQAGGTNNFSNRAGGANFGNRPGGTSVNRGTNHNFSSFRDFHRSFNAPRRFRAPAYQRPTGWYNHRWTFGEFLPSLFWASNYWLNDYSSYGLPPPPYGAIWVREGYDALLVDRDSGEIITVEYDVFY